ncbi:hypothetical protein pdam_00018316 [Pocillopora damicornis]|uniref:Potassium channel domain-containing protein n=1 Tax=Pocillopora damicornis TaxID=46731 RepID=A0A3M6U9X1_POCDA|nr:hypothetical protein pdam_00018316 [Pocillopora damicornis]
MKTQNLRTILLTICCVSYLLVGAAIFSALEYEEDQEMRKNMTILHKTLTKKYNISDEDIGKWLQYLDSKANIDADLYQWSFAGSVYFATTVITTIDSRETRFDHTYVGISLLFIFFGLTIVGSVMNQLALRLLTASQTKETTDQLLVEGPCLCEKCSRRESIDIFNLYPSDLSTTLLKNYEEEIAFTTYKGLHRKRASI